MPNTLAFDVGGTKIAWGLFQDDGKLIKKERCATPKDRDRFLAALSKIIEEQREHIDVVGMGIPGTVSADHQDTIVCPNIPSLSHVEIAAFIKEEHELSTVLDNDARCALIGEVWLGEAKEYSSTVMITLGTGVGGAVMQRGVILPHPLDISREIAQIVADPTDLYPNARGRGTIEALLGGRNLEERFGIRLADIAANVRRDDPEAKEVWSIIQGYFASCIRSIYDAYGCKQILVGGKGCTNLEYYLGDWQPPCPVKAAKLGEDAGLYGAGRIGLDWWEKELDEQGRDWSD